MKSGKEGAAASFVAERITNGGHVGFVVRSISETDKNFVIAVVREIRSSLF